jgi:UTP--glucose-1-phosphate uridylyltransferase
VLTPAVFDTLASTEPGKLGELQLTDGIKGLLKREKVYGYTFEGRRYDTGDKLGMLKAMVEFALQREDLGPNFRAFLKGLQL